jgi:hypothetical protein
VELARKNIERYVLELYRTFVVELICANTRIKASVAVT